MERIFIDSEFQDFIDMLQKERMCGDYDALREDAKRLEEMARKSSNCYGESVAYYYLAVYYLMYNEEKKAILYCDRVKENYKKEKFHYLYAICCSLAGVAFVHLSDKQNAIEYLLDGYYVSLEHSFYDIQIQVLNNIGSIFYELGNYKKAVECYLSCYEIFQKSQYYNPQLKEMILLNLSSSYVRKKKKQEAKYWEQKYREEFGNSKNPLVLYSLLVNHILMEEDTELSKEIENNIEYFFGKIKDGWHDLYSIKLIFEIIDFCLKTKNMPLIEKGIQLVEYKIKYNNSIQYKEQLESVKIRWHQLTNNQEELLKALIQYHDCVQKRKQEKKEIESSGLLSKIRLEQAEYRRRQAELKNEELQKKNELDPFTQLLNKKTFEDNIQKALLFRSQKSEKDAFIIMDLDDFKSVNDQYGHLAGDEVLQKIARVLKQKVRETDYIGRIGGDEFALFLFDMTDKNEIERWVQDLLQKIQTIQYTKKFDRPITVSVGIALVKEESFYSELLERADKALYQVKKRGKNTYYMIDENVKN